MASFLDVTRFRISKVYSPFLVVNGVYFHWSVSRKPLQTALSLRLFRLVLFILNVHPLSKFQVFLVVLLMPLVILLGISGLERRNLFHSVRLVLP